VCVPQEIAFRGTRPLFFACKGCLPLLLVASLSDDLSSFGKQPKGHRTAGCSEQTTLPEGRPEPGEPADRKTEQSFI
jgi:hypothetical protein